jgi:hypothetical protein
MLNDHGLHQACESRVRASVMVETGKRNETQHALWWRRSRRVTFRYHDRRRKCGWKDNGTYRASGGGGRRQGPPLQHRMSPSVAQEHDADAPGQSSWGRDWSCCSGSDVPVRWADKPGSKIGRWLPQLLEKWRSWLFRQCSCCFSLQKFVKLHSVNCSHLQGTTA